MKKSWMLVLFVVGILLVGFVGVIDAKKGENSGGSTSGSNSVSSGSGSDSSGSSGDSDSSGSGSDSEDDDSEDKSNGDSKKVSSDDSLDSEDDNEVEDSEDAEDDDSENKGSSKIKEEQTIILVDENNVQYEVRVRIETRDGGEDVKIKVRGIEVDSELEFEQEGNSLKAKLSNGAKSDIKILPDTASQTAIDKLQTRDVEVRVKEVGEGNNLSVVYEADGNKTVKFLGLFKVRSEVNAVISAENGEVLRLEKPWWYFLAFKEGVVDCDADNLDLCDDSTECAESGLIWFNESCILGCPTDSFLCDDNVTTIFRSEDLGCEFNVTSCPEIIIEEPSNETIVNETVVNDTSVNSTI